VGPAEVYRLPGAVGRLGFISAMSQPFCETCNRLRLTATGELRSCLFDGGEVSIWPAIRPHIDESELIDMMRRCVAMKPETHSGRGNRAMSQMGG
jgi:cyclic pyranopterin phosphate synthase